MFCYRNTLSVIFFFFLILNMLTGTPVLADPPTATPPPVAPPSMVPRSTEGSTAETPPVPSPNVPPPYTEALPGDTPRSRDTGNESDWEWLQRSGGKLLTDPGSAFAKNPGVEIAKELENLPFDNAAKYGALFVLSKIPVTAPVAITTAKIELGKDVAVATAKGLINAMRLTDAQRKKALARIAVLQAVGNWTAFIKDLAGIANIEPDELAVAVGQIPPTMQDLYQGADALSGVFSMGIPAMIKSADIYSSFCEFADAEKIYGEVYDKLAELELEAFSGMAANHAVIHDQDPRYHKPSYEELMSFNTGSALQSGKLMSYSRFARYRKMFINSGNWRSEISEKLKELRKAKKKYPEDHATVKSQLEEAANALAYCDAARGSRILEDIRNKYLKTTLKGLVKDEQEAVDPQCWGWVADEYNRIRRNYIEWADHFKPGKDTARVIEMSSTAIEDLESCQELDSLDGRIDQIEKILRGSKGRCIDKEIAEESFSALKRKKKETDENQSCPEQEDLDVAYVVVRLSGSGLYPHWAGGSHKISGSSQYIYKIVKGDEPLPTLEEISASYRANVCDMINPWGFGWVEDTPPGLFNQKKPAVKLITVPYKNAGDIDASLIYSDWKSSGSDGPGLWELKKGCE